MSNDELPDAPAVDASVLAHVDEAKRGFLRKLVVGTAYAAPAIASFSLAGLSANEALAYSSNQPA